MSPGTALILRIASLSALIAQLGRFHPEVPNYRAQRDKLRAELKTLHDIDLTPQ